VRVWLRERRSPTAAFVTAAHGDVLRSRLAPPNLLFRWLIHKTRSFQIFTRVSLASALACQDVRP
jgi:hypothetical protein